MVSIVHAARDIGRVRDVSRVLVRHGFGGLAAHLGLKRNSDSPADPSSKTADRFVRIRRVLEDLGPSFVKLGQIASTRADVLPSDLIAELRKLQDGVAPVPFEELKERAEASLGGLLDELFVSVDPEPLAAASVAQVHRAVLATDSGNKDVVIKVQRPGISETIASDLDILHSLAALLERTVPESRSYSPVALVQQFDRAITNELDFTIEAENAQRFARNFESRPEVRFPEVHKQVSSKHVVCIEYFNGVKIDKAAEQGFEGLTLARAALSIIIKQIFEDGFFHADPHPGNVLILGETDAPVYALIDLGMVGRLSPRMRDQTVDLMIAAGRRDYEAIADALLALATPSGKVDLQAFRAEVAMLADKYLGKTLKDIQVSALMRDLVGASTRFGLEVPPDFLLVGKALMTIEGIGKEIAPQMDILEETRPYFLDLLKLRYSPERIGNDLWRNIERFGLLTTNMPDQVREVVDDLRLGRLRIQTVDPGLEKAAENLGRQIFVALVVCSLIMASTYLLTQHILWASATTAVLALLVLGAHTIASWWRRINKR